VNPYAVDKFWKAKFTILHFYSHFVS